MFRFIFFALVLFCPVFTSAAPSPSSPTVLRISESKIVVNGKEANRFAVRQRDGQFGLKAKKGAII